MKKGKERFKMLNALVVFKKTKQNKLVDSNHWVFKASDSDSTRDYRGHCFHLSDLNSKASLA